MLDSNPHGDQEGYGMLRGIVIWPRWVAGGRIRVSKDPEVEPKALIASKTAFRGRTEGEPYWIRTETVTVRIAF